MVHEIRCDPLRSGPAVGGYILTLFIDSCQDRVAVPIVLASVRCSASEIDRQKARVAGLLTIQSASLSGKTRENGRYRKSAASQMFLRLEIMVFTTDPADCDFRLSFQSDFSCL